ncbi:hypothetical protein TWF730_011238 [Orbilia blumenaviensis]|uniref:Uncharacterized protein n=1 Tax=Orbilia blumenaviensis TaxID=1796055 RepID=A0AAV9UK18_9PEZI
MTGARMTCPGCGKLSGVDDFVHNAFTLGVHDTKFILRILFDGPDSATPDHGLQCSGCGDYFEGMIRWGEDD